MTEPILVTTDSSGYFFVPVPESFGGQAYSYMRVSARHYATAQPILDEAMEGDHYVTGQAAPNQHLTVHFGPANERNSVTTTADAQGFFKAKVPEVYDGWVHLGMELSVEAATLENSGAVYLEYVDANGRLLQPRQILVETGSQAVGTFYQAPIQNRITDENGIEYWFIRRDKAFSGYSERITNRDKTVRFIYEPVVYK